MPHVPVAFPAPDEVSGLPCSLSHMQCRQLYGDTLCCPFTELRVQVHLFKTLLSYFPTFPSVIKTSLLEDLELQVLFLKMPQVAGSPLKFFMCKQQQHRAWQQVRDADSRS